MLRALNIGTCALVVLASGCRTRTFGLEVDAGRPDATADMESTRCEPRPEICNGLDDDCDGLTDGDDTDALPGVGMPCGVVDEGGSPVGECTIGVTACAPEEGCIEEGNCVICSGAVLPTFEICDEKDNDCDG